MRANLIYNPNSGGSNQVTPEAMVEALAAAGYDPVYTATTCEEDLDRLLPEAEGLVVAVGGDGTFRAAATRLVGRNLPIAIVPAGTANNIGRALGVTGNPLEIISRLKNPVRYHFDVGQVTSPWGVDYFLEAFGYGLYADLLYYYEPEKGKSILRSISAAVQRLSGPHPHPAQVVMDGVEISDDYLLLDILNTDSMGPRVKLAPAADPTDGELDVVRINESNRDGLLAYVNGLLTENLEELPSVEVSRCRRLEITPAAPFPFHADAQVLPRKIEQATEATPAGEDQQDLPAIAGPVIVEIQPRALEIWLPEPVVSPAPISDLSIIQLSPEMPQPPEVRSPV